MSRLVKSLGVITALVLVVAVGQALSSDPERDSRLPEDSFVTGQSLAEAWANPRDVTTVNPAVRQDWSNYQRLRTPSISAQDWIARLDSKPNASQNGPTPLDADGLRELVERLAAWRQTPDNEAASTNAERRISDKHNTSSGGSSTGTSTTADDPGIGRGEGQGAGAGAESSQPRDHEGVGTGGDVFVVPLSRGNSSKGASLHTYWTGDWKFELSHYVGPGKPPDEEEPFFMTALLADPADPCRINCQYLVMGGDLFTGPTELPAQTPWSPAGNPYCEDKETGEHLFGYVAKDSVAKLNIVGRDRDPLDRSSVATALELRLEVTWSALGKPEGSCRATYRETHVYRGTPENTGAECSLQVGMTPATGHSLHGAHHLYLVYEDETTRQIGMRAGPSFDAVREFEDTATGDFDLGSVDFDAFGPIRATVGPFNRDFVDYGDSINRVTAIGGSSLCGLKERLLSASSDIDGKVIYNAFFRNSNTYIGHLMRSVNAPLVVPPRAKIPGFGNDYRD